MERYKEKLMDDKDLKRYIDNKKKIFSKIYEKKDFSIFKKNAEKFIEFYKERPIEISKKNIGDYISRQLKARIFLGIGCELLLKSIYLKEGYCINWVKQNKLRGNKFINWLKRLFRLKKNFLKPYKISDIPQQYLLSERTHDMNYYIKHLEKLFCNRITHEIYINYVKRGLEIAKLWRNKDSHIGGGYHRESGMDFIDIQNSIKYIYFFFYNTEKFPIVSSKLNVWLSQKVKSN